MVITSLQKAMRVPRKKLAGLVAFVVRRQGGGLNEVDLAVVGRRQMAALNRRWLGHAGPTDVLSFDLAERRAGRAAVIVVCGELAARQGPRHGNGVERELMLYVVHGLLHLMGHDDSTAAAAARMHAREEELLDAFAEFRRRR